MVLFLEINGFLGRGKDALLFNEGDIFIKTIEVKSLILG